jgi:hypothetical protein
VSPPCFGNVSRLLGAANHVRRTPTTESRAAGVSPPWYGNRTRSTERFLLNEGVRIPRGAYAPPFLVVLRCGHLPVKLRLVRYTNARLQEGRAPARRSSVTQRSCKSEALIGSRIRMCN